MRHTKRTGIGHEDVGYSYAVIRRGPRPSPVNISVGRVGAVGKRAMEVAQFANEEMRELEVEVDETGAVTSAVLAEIPEIEDIVSVQNDELEPSDLQAALRREAYEWPRLVFRPIKNPGHIILDSCTKEGTSGLVDELDDVLISEIRGNNASYNSQISRQTTILRCSKI